MVGCTTIHIKKRKPEWLSTLLRSKFFGSCVHHRELRKNEKNVFCIDCNLCFCKHCINGSSVHCLHKWLQICKYVYHDVVRLQDIQKHLDCSKIQTYKINGEKAVHLNPRGNCKVPKQSKSKPGGSCEACGRHIQEFPNRFCSIACKVSKVPDMFKDPSPGEISFPISNLDEHSLKEDYSHQGNTQVESEYSICFTESSEEFQACWLNPAMKPRKQLHKRKGVPRRAPFL